MPTQTPTLVNAKDAKKSLGDFLCDLCVICVLCDTMCSSKGCAFAQLLSLYEPREEALYQARTECALGMSTLPGNWDFRFPVEVA